MAENSVLPLDNEDKNGSISSLEAVFSHAEPTLFQCIDISLDVPVVEIQQLRQLVDQYLIMWRSTGVRAVWVQVPIHHSSAITTFYERGFLFHHAQTHHVMMTRWLSDKETNNLPKYADHTLGVCGFVINAKGEVLLIQEKYNAKVKKKPWKFPGGQNDKGEDFGQVAIRETLEETGLKCNFITTLCMRQLHKFRWSCSDLYVACLLEPSDPSCLELHPDPREIADAKWMPLDDYAQDPFTSPLNRHIVECYRAYRDSGAAIYTNSVSRMNGKAHDTVYSNIKLEPST